MTAWAAEYIGLPFKSGGRDRTGLDCWGLCRLVLAEHFGVEMPSYGGYGDTSFKNAPSLREIVTKAALADFVEILKGHEQPGDIAVLRQGGFTCHVGIVVEPGRMLHIEQGHDAVLEDYRRPKWAHRVDSFWRPKVLI